jgi:DNA-directed RNA polymerase sigma subunit (sigma70/sigma32)
MAVEDDPVEIYKRELATVTPLTEEDETRLFREATRPGEAGEIAKKRLIETKLHLVLPVVERYASYGLSMLDLIQEGNLGLMRAIDHPEDGSGDFSNYATACIEDAISGALTRSQSR